MPARNHDECVFIIAPVGQDAQAMAALLQEQGWQTEICARTAPAGRGIDRAGLILLTEEALGLPQTDQLLSRLPKQPAWSELPVILLTSGGEARKEALLAFAAAAAGSLTLLERPVRTETLLRSVEVALRSRRRQYLVRHLMAEQQRSEEGLRASEDRYRAFIANSTEGVWRMEFDPPVDTSLPAEQQVEQAYRNGRIAECNDAMARMYGLCLADGMRGKTLDFTHPASDPGARAFITSFIQAGYRVADVESRDWNKTRFAKSIIGLVEQGRLVRMWGMQRDITQRKQMEESLAERANEQAALFQLTDRLQRAESQGDVFNAALDSIRRALTCDRASIVLCDDSGVMRFVAWHGLSEAYRKALDGYNPWRPEDRDPATITANDVETGELSPALREIMKREGIAALAFIPLVVGGKLLGRFMTAFNASHHFSENELKLALNISRQLAFGIERNRTAEALRRSEERARQQYLELDMIYNAAPQGLGVLDSELRFLRVNERLAQINGFSPAEHVGRTVRELVPALAEPAEAAIRQVLEKGNPVQYICRGESRAEPGAERIWDAQWYPLRDKSGRTAGIGIVVEEITERKRAEEAKARLAAIVEGSEDAIISKNLDGVITSWNRGAERLFGYPAPEMIGRPITVIIPPDHLPEESTILERIRRGESIQPFETVRARKDGRLLDISLAISPLVDAEGAVIGASKIARDITARKQTESELRRVADAAAYRILLSDALRALSDSTQIQSEAARILGQHLHADRAHYAEIEPNDEYAIVARDYTRGLPRQAGGRHRLADYASLSNESRAGRTFVATDLATDSRLTRAEKESLAGLPVAAIIIAPLIIQDRLVAILAIHSVAPRIWMPDEVRLVEETAERTWGAVERVRAEEALHESEDRFRTLVAQVKDYAIFRMDVEGRPVSWNEGVERVFGFAEAEFVGQDILPKIFTPEDVQNGRPARELREAAEMGTANNDVWMRRKDGSRFYAAGVTTGLRNAAGEHIGYTKVLRDETATKLADETLKDAGTQLEQYATNLERTVAERTKDLRAANEQLEAFVYSIAHDLRAPLRSLSGVSQVLIDGHATQLDADGQGLVNRIQAAAEFMDKMLMDLLEYGRTTRGEIELGPVEVHQAWETALAQYQAQMDQTGAQVEAVEPLPTVRAHEATLIQCLANLLGNALKFVAPGVKPRIRFWAEERGDYARLWMEDNGIGIPPALQERAFRVFERLHGGRYHGTGIGLSIVRKGIDRMGGRVGLESTPGKGSRFWIDLRKAV